MRFLSILLCLFGSFSIQAQTVVKEKLLRDVQILSHDSLQGRKTGSKESKVAQEYIVSRLNTIKAEAINKSYYQHFKMFSRQLQDSIAATNIVALKKGKLDSYIVISAHYDHLGVANSEIYNGADDNASGTAALMAMVEYFAKVSTEHNLLFVFFDAEESGLRGARHFVKSPPVPLSKIVLNINMDMISRNVNNEIYITGTHYYPELKKIVEPMGSKSVSVKFGHDDPEVWKKSDNWTMSSDHGPFHSAKIPFLYYGVEDHPDYHKSTDDFANINPDFYFNVVNTIIQHIAALDKGLEK
jgi:Zn-dependent M28 family amino/carboxypeptidase